MCDTISPRTSIALLFVALGCLVGCESKSDSSPTGGDEARNEGAEPRADTEEVASGAESADTGASSSPQTPDARGRHVDATVGIEGDFGFVRRRSIADLADIVEPSGEAPTTMALGSRSRGGERSVVEGIKVRTNCGASFCVDGLFAGGRTMLEPIPTQKPGPKGRLERVVRVTWATDAYVSVYIATSRFSGGANAKNDLRCRTFDRKTGEIVPLEEILEDTAADRLLQKAEGLMDPNRAIAVMGRRIEGSGMEFGAADYRLARTSGYKGIDPEIILCGDGSAAGDRGTILEMQLEEFPVGYLLRPVER